MTTTQTISRERLEELLAHCQSESPKCLAPVSAETAVEVISALLGTMNGEPVMLTDEQIDAVLDAPGNMLYVIADKRERLRMFARDIIRVAAQQPAPVAVPDERYQHLSELYHAQEKRLFKLAQRLKGPSFDKYAYSPSQAIDVLEAAICGEQKEDGSACRAAMQSEPVTAANTLPCWIKCSERMPGSQEWVLVTAKWANQQVLCWDDVSNRWTDFEDQSYFHDMFSHWMPLPAAPEQEV